jgi:hypothetical protein
MRVSYGGVGYLVFIDGCGVEQELDGVCVYE